MTLDEFIALYNQMVASQQNGHYTSVYTGEQIDDAVRKVLEEEPPAEEGEF